MRRRHQRSLVRLVALLVLLCGSFHAGFAPLASFVSRALPQADSEVSPAHASSVRDAVTTSPLFGMDNILPNGYSAIPGIKNEQWTTIAADDGAHLNRWEFRWSD